MKKKEKLKEETNLALAVFQLARMTVSRCVGGLVATQGYLYAVGGTEELVRASRRLSRYHPDTDTWEDLSPMIEARFDAGQCFPTIQISLRGRNSKIV